MKEKNQLGLPRMFLAMGVCASVLAGCGGDDNDNQIGSNGPLLSEKPVVHQTGNAASGKDVFRSETFGNEAFWTDALRLQ